LEPACRHQSIEHTATAVFVTVWLVSLFREERSDFIWFSWQKNIFFSKSQPQANFSLLHDGVI